VVAALKGASGNITEAAQKMGVSRMQFYRLLKKYGIKPVNS
jgi:transcriptional regulator of acetoin/glycerol metabolism